MEVFVAVGYREGLAGEAVLGSAGAPATVVLRRTLGR